MKTSTQVGIFLLILFPFLLVILVAIISRRSEKYNPWECGSDPECDPYVCNTANRCCKYVSTPYDPIISCNP